ncbi:MAG: cyclic 2,3-diphosphoglycerate synthase [Candidatus Nanoarchaeia archaeon]|jgi:predicted GTPase|nr:cyclic 2,3-diphosphoglycerate synthase [Candidatus Nanoarchaeia archaeon]|tara:strand:- start:7701 stop:9017 length:1317 start_codon:yes stop_codon:yes gene_type:complete
MKKRVIILGAAGRDYHNFLTYFKNNPRHEVVAFTQTQIPGIEKRKFPKQLAGRLYKKNIPFYPESKLPKLIKKLKVDEVVFSYSDVSHEYVMHLASIVISNGANFILLGPNSTMIKSKKPIISVCAVRTGSGKSQTSRKIGIILKNWRYKVVVIRHPMPYGNLTKQKIQRFANYDDLKENDVTIEEREEYEPWINNKIVVYAGVDYKEILKKAEKEADVIIWDGGNNDLPFYYPNLHIVVVDPHRAGHELLYHPGESNFRMADVFVINKIGTSNKENVKKVFDNIKKINPKAKVIFAKSDIIVDKPWLIKNKRVLIVEDGPTLTHGGMTYGAGSVAAKKYKAKSIIDAERYAEKSIKKVYEEYDHLKKILPAMGYGKKQIKSLQKTINKSKCDVVIDGSPVNLLKLIKINKEIVNVDYELNEVGRLNLEKVLKKLKIK